MTALNITTMRRPGSTLARKLTPGVLGLIVPNSPASPRLAPSPRRFRAPTKLRFVQDTFGNKVGMARFSRCSKELSIESVVCVEHSPCDNFVLEDGGRPFHVDYRVKELRDVAPCLERHQLIRVDEVGRPARQFHPRRAIEAFGLLMRLSQAIHHGFLYKRREAKGVQPPIQTFRLGHGSCRDFAMLMIVAARSFGLAARFSSGYLALRSDPHERTSGTARGSTHAWAHIYQPSVSWIDFDPTSGSVGHIGFVTVTVAPDRFKSRRSDLSWSQSPRGS
jgi:hypothetical protein